MDLIERFEDYLRNTDRGTSARFYIGDVKKFKAWFESRHGSWEPAAITPLDLVEYRSHLQRTGGRRRNGEPPQPASPATVNRALVSLSVFCQWAVRQGIMAMDPAADIKPVEEEELAPRWLDRRQQAAFVRAVQKGGSLRDQAICGLMLHAGLRVSEVCALNRDDLQLSDRSGWVTIRQGKGNKQRKVPLNVTIRRILESYLKTLPNDQVALFASERAERITPRGVQYLVSQYAYDARLEDVTPHTLRHTFCKNLIDQGVSIEQVATLAGHSSLDVTRRYVTPSAQDLQAAVERTAWE
jgi:site-specific recombinase XerD